MFRWQKLPSGKWLGLDGDHYYIIEEIAKDGCVEFKIESNASILSFKGLFQLNGTWDYQLKQILQLSPELVPFVKQYCGIRLMQPHSIVETLFSFLCTSNNHIKRIESMVQKLGEQGRVIGKIEGIKMFAFPSLQDIALVTEDELRKMGFGYRAKTIPLAAKDLTKRGGEKYLADIRESGNYREIIQELISLPGVGPKLADCIALFGFHCHEAVPFDIHLWRISVQVFFPEWLNTNLTHKKYHEAGDFFRERFGSLAGLAHHILYFADLDNSLKPSH